MLESIFKIGKREPFNLIKLKSIKERTQKGNTEGIITLAHNTNPFEIPLYKFWGQSKIVIIRTIKIEVKQKRVIFEIKIKLKSPL